MKQAVKHIHFVEKWQLPTKCNFPMREFGA
jgi:hypothetical protein